MNAPRNFMFVLYTKEKNGLNYKKEKKIFVLNNKCFYRLANEKIFFLVLNNNVSFLFKSRYSKFETLLMAHYWQVSSLGTNVKINIFGIHPLTSANMSIEKTISIILLCMTASTNSIIYFYSKIKTVGGCSFFRQQTVRFS